ncbi:cytochrome aa3 quinol oxidase subunit IV [Paenibacillus sp. SC116]|uniref:cytochrome aa3 quinol oxidase subunit IV n=1 Tax=Paenibacillus sp. SC116 TaxID=2968986 RepID=UPI00215B4002|nr:cytochrome aa3 quinol oxidase subunit IV [Paenibacillus sp. SC116]MCR8845565.1 cytochrome aa3 quinol oxidase subunit IV [Paenibacillus sp. SC116]
MKRLFPIGHVMGFIFSLVLTLVALLVVYTDMSYAMGMTILVSTAIIQATVQLFMFMHVNESKEDKNTVISNILYAVVVSVITIFGSMWTLLWDW